MAKEGYLFIDHRASPGIPEDAALKLGLDPAQVKEGKVMEAATLKCAHCPAVFIKNVWRTRERGHCFQCNAYICDSCVAASRDPNYRHTSLAEVIDKVTSGKYELSGSTSMPILTRKDSSDV